MVTQAEVAEHRSAISDVATLAVAQLVTDWPGLPLDTPERMRTVLADLLEDLTATFADAAGSIGADWYDDLRAAGNTPGSFSAVLGAAPTRADLESAASYAASALYVSTDKALADAAAAVEQFVADADRRTIEASTAQDPARPRWARIAQSDACAFCALLATRGPVYRGADTAGQTLSGSAYHRHCSCVAAPVWDRSEFVLSEAASAWSDIYDQARAELGPGASPKRLLSRMRAIGALR